MTQQSRSKEATEFSEWLRNQREIDSSLGFVASDIDYMWRNYRNNQWMLIEEKRRGVQVKFPQTETIKIIHNACKSDINYKGFHVIVFENTSPDDGRIYLDGIEIDRDKLICFLRFEFDKLM